MERALDPRDYGSLGLGCWAIGGPWGTARGEPLGWGTVDDAESIAAIHRGLDLGVRIFDTADTYGCGHSERILGWALGERRDDVLIVTKFGNTFDEDGRRSTGQDCSPAYIRRACEASLRRLGTNHIDVYLLHLWDIEDEQVAPVQETLEGLVASGHIRSYGWSTDLVERVRRFAASPNCAAVEIGLNVLAPAREMAEALAELELAAFVRSPLAMGLLAGRILRDTELSDDDIRGVTPDWLEWFESGRPVPEFMDRVDAIRGLLMEDGRSMAQGALGWLWAYSPWAIPIPGFRSRAHVEQNESARDFGPLSPDQMNRIETALDR